MTDKSPEKTKTKTWSAEDKLELYQAIVEAYNAPIPWKEVKLAEGRTINAATSLYNRDRKIVEKKQSADAGDGEEPTTPVKAKRGRKASPDTPKKTPKKSKAKDVKTDTEGEDLENEGDEGENDDDEEKNEEGETV